MTKIVLGLVLLGCIALVYGQKEQKEVIQKEVVQNPNDPQWVQKVNFVLRVLHDGVTATKVLHATTQTILKGIKFRVTYISREKDLCTLIWVVEHRLPDVISYRCRRSKLGS